MARPGKVSSRRGRTPADEKRPIRWRRYEYLFLIVCEDEATEPAYFTGFLPQIPDDTLYLRPVGTGLDPLGVVERAQREWDSLAAEARREVDEVWVVFDKDDADREPGKTRRFQLAEQLAGQQQFRLAFSNEVFELWLLLHLTDVSASEPLHRQEVYRLLGEALQQHPAFAEFVYDHHQTPAATVLRAIAQIGNEALAHERAEMLLAAHGDKALLETNPSTRVHQLVRRLRELIAYYQNE